MNGQSVTFEIDGGSTRYVNRGTTGDSGSTTEWSSGSLWVSGIVIETQTQYTTTTYAKQHFLFPFSISIFYFCCISKNLM